MEKKTRIKGEPEKMLNRVKRIIARLLVIFQTFLLILIIFVGMGVLWYLSYSMWKIAHPEAPWYAWIWHN